MSSLDWQQVGDATLALIFDDLWQASALRDNVGRLFFDCFLRVLARLFAHRSLNLLQSLQHTIFYAHLQRDTHSAAADSTSTRSQP